MPKGKGYGSPSTKIGNAGKKFGDKSGGGKHPFLPATHESNLGGGNKNKSVPASTESIKGHDFLPKKPE